MSDDRDLAQQGVADAFKTGIGRLFEIYAQGRLMDQPVDELKARTLRGLANFHLALDEMRQTVDQFFGEKS